MINIFNTRLQEQPNNPEVIAAYVSHIARVDSISLGQHLGRPIDAEAAAFWATRQVLDSLPNVRLERIRTPAKFWRSAVRYQLRSYAAMTMTNSNECDSTKGTDLVQAELV